MIFISYATENLPYATEIYRQLQLKGYNVWFAPVAIRYGANFTEEIGNAILQTSAVGLYATIDCMSKSINFHSFESSLLSTLITKTGTSFVIADLISFRHQTEFLLKREQIKISALQEE